MRCSIFCHPWRLANLLELIMAAIAEWFVLAVLATTQRDLGVLPDFKLHRCDIGRFVRAIAERLGLGTATGAPPVGAGGEFQDKWRFLGDFGLIHVGWCSYEY
jgi:hypothetical protein